MSHAYVHCVEGKPVGVMSDRDAILRFLPANAMIYYDRDGLVRAAVQVPGKARPYNERVHSFHLVPVDQTS